MKENYPNPNPPCCLIVGLIDSYIKSKSVNILHKYSSPLYKNTVGESELELELFKHHIIIFCTHLKPHKRNSFDILTYSRAVIPFKLLFLF